MSYDLVCIHCGGSGIRDEEPCDSCEGYGYHLTDEGDALIQFLQRRGLGFPMSPKAENELRGMIE